MVAGVTTVPPVLVDVLGAVLELVGVLLTMLLTVGAVNPLTGNDTLPVGLYVDVVGFGAEVATGVGVAVALAVVVVVANPPAGTGFGAMPLAISVLLLASHCA
jgi:hypothetical protein